MKGREKIFEKVMAKKIPNLLKTMNSDPRSLKNGGG